MTKQEIFNKVWDWFVVKNNPRSVSPTGSCCYRGVNGSKCAIGVLLPDELYQPRFEGYLAKDLLMALATAGPAGVAFVESIGGEVDSDLFLQQLQDAHDDSHVCPVYGALRDVAEEFKLAIPS